VYDALLKTRGVVPNMFKTLAHTPALALATAGYLKALLNDGALPGFYKELIAMRLSGLLSSECAVKAHALSARQKGATDAQISATRADFESGPFTPAEKLGFRAAERLHRSAADINDDFFAELKRHFTVPQIIELIAAAAAFELFPRFVDALRIPITPTVETPSGGTGL
jgi:AhpD family alkylhydroperoxidase